MRLELANLRIVFGVLRTLFGDGGTGTGGTSPLGIT